MVSNNPYDNEPSKGSNSGAFGVTTNGQLSDTFFPNGGLLSSDTLLPREAISPILDLVRLDDFASLLIGRGCRIDSSQHSQELRAWHSPTFLTSLRKPTLFLDASLHSGHFVNNETPFTGHDVRLAIANTLDAALRKQRSTNRAIKLEILSAVVTGETHKLYDAVVVLGSRSQNPLHPSLDAKARIETLLDLTLHGLQSPIIFSGGGLLEDGSTTTQTESDQLITLAHKYIPKQISAHVSNSFQERDSSNTVENIVFTLAQIVLPHNFKRILVISSDYHVERVRTICDWIGGDALSFDVAGAESTHLTPAVYQSKLRGEQKHVQNFLAIAQNLMPRGNLAAVSEWSRSRLKERF